MTRLRVWLTALALVFLLAACGTTEDEKKREEFRDAIAVLNAEDELLADPILAGESLVLPPAYENEAWAQTGGEADHALVHLAAPENLRRLWRTKIVSRKGTRAPLTAPPIIGPKNVYVIDGAASVAAFNAQTGKRLWRTNLAPDVRERNGLRFNIFSSVHPADLGFGGGAALGEGALFVTSGFGFVAALNPDNGDVLWTYDAPGPMRNPPLVADDLVIAVSISNEVVALDQATGEERWSYQSFEEAARYLASAAPAFSDGTVMVPFSSGEVASLSAANGRVQWQAVISRTSRLNALSVLGDIAGSPVIDRGAVFSVSQSGQMAGIDLRSGQVAWEAPVGGFHTPWLAGETLFVLSNRGDLVAVNRVDGRIRWTNALPMFRNEKKRKKRILWAGPVLAGGRLWLTNNQGRLVAVSPSDGEIVERYKLRGDANLPPVVAANRIYAVTNEGHLEAWGERPSKSDEDNDS